MNDPQRTQHGNIALRARSQPNPQRFIADRIRVALTHMRLSRTPWAESLLGHTANAIPPPLSEAHTALSHRTPLAEFDLLDYTQFQLATHPSNLVWITKTELAQRRQKAAAAARLQNTASRRAATAETRSRKDRLLPLLAQLGDLLRDHPEVGPLEDLRDSVRMLERYGTRMGYLP